MSFPSRPAVRLVAAGAAFAGYIGAVVAANKVTEHLDFVPVGFGLTAAAGTYAAGLALLTRDFLQDAAGRWAVLAAIAVGGALSWMFSDPSLAFASTAAFLTAELCDMAVYTPLRRRGWAVAVLASNAVGAVLDTLVFLHLMHLLTADAVKGQMVGKAWATVLVVAAVVAVRRIRGMRRPVEAVAK